MTSSESPLLSFYPDDFKLDQNEKKRDWEAIVLLPFIDEELLLNTIGRYYNQLKNDEKAMNQSRPSLCFTTGAKLTPIGNSLPTNPYFPPLTETRAVCREIHIDFYRPDHLQIKFDRFDERNKVNFPKFPVLNVLPYKFDYKTSAVSVFETSSKGTTLVLRLTRQCDSDCINYNNDWNPKDENTAPPFQITNQKLLIERYLGKHVFVNWPHFQHGVVCAISDFHNLYVWSHAIDGVQFYFDLADNAENIDFRKYTQTPIYVSDYPFELSIDSNKTATYRTVKLNEVQTQIEYLKALSINGNYEKRQGISIGPIPMLLYVCPLLGYRTRSSSSTNKCRTTIRFSNQALAYPIQTTLLKVPNYKYDGNHLPQTLNDYFKTNDSVFILKAPYYSSIGSVEQINQDNQGKYSISCQLKSFNGNDHPDLHQYQQRLESFQLQYYTAQDVAAQLKTLPCVIGKLTGRVGVTAQNQRRRANPTNIGLAWKNNRPVKQVN